MRLLAFIVLVCVMLLATCSAPEIKPAPVQTDAPALPSQAEAAPTPTEAVSSPKLPEAPFEVQTYINETA